MVAGSSPARGANFFDHPILRTADGCSARAAVHVTLKFELFPKVCFGKHLSEFLCTFIFGVDHSHHIRTGPTVSSHRREMHGDRAMRLLKRDGASGLHYRRGRGRGIQLPIGRHLQSKPLHRGRHAHRQHMSVA